MINSINGGDGNNKNISIGVVTNISREVVMILSSQAEFTIIFMQEPDDIIIMLGVINNIDGGYGDDIITSIGLINTIDGYGDDIIFASGAYNNIDGGTGDDIRPSLGIINTISGGAGDDIIAAFGLNQYYRWRNW